MANQPPNFLPVANCRYSYLGIISIVHHLNQIPAFNALTDGQLRAAAIAILSAGATTDADHAVSPHRFHHIYYDLNNKNRTAMTWRQGLRDWCMQAISDQLVMFERAGGSTTVLIHTPATRPPGTNAAVGEVKMDMILPRVLLGERPEVGFALSRMVQYFAEHVGVPALHRFDDAANTSSWPNAGVPAPATTRGENQAIIPASATPRYMFYGRPPANLERAISIELYGQTHLAPPIPAPIPAAPAVTAPTPTALPTEPPTAPVATQHPALASASIHRDRRVADDDWVLQGEDLEESHMISPPGKPHMKLAHSLKDPYTAEELLAWGEANYHDDDVDKPLTASTGKGKQRQRDTPSTPRLDVRLAALQLRIAELESTNVAAEQESTQLAETVAGLNERVEELEDANATKDVEIIGLRAALKAAMAGRGDASDHGGSPARMARSSTADTFGNATRTAARSTPLAGGRTPCPSSPSLPPSPSSISSVTSMSMSTASTSMPRRAHPREAYMSPSRQSNLPRTPSRESRVTVAPFGPASDRLITVARLSPITHALLRDIHETATMSQWIQRLQDGIPGCSAAFALELANAMASDTMSSGGSEA